MTTRLDQHLARMEGKLALLPSDQDSVTREKAEERCRRIRSSRSQFEEQLGHPIEIKSFDQFDVSISAKMKPIVAACRQWCSDVPERIRNCQGMVLYGPVGGGKDHLAVACCSYALDAGTKVKFANGRDVAGDSRNAIATESEKEFIRSLIDPSLLFISDPLPPFGTLSNWQADTLYRVVESRQRGGKPTIVTLNVANDAEADSRIGAPTWDRLCHNSWKLKCDWPSYRKPAFELT